MKIHKIRLIAFVGAALILSVLTACGQTNTAIDLDELLGSEEQVAAEETEQPTAEDTTVTEVPVVTPLPDTDENCVACHASEELLRALATEPESEESLSSGEG